MSTSNPFERVWVSASELCPQGLELQMQRVFASLHKPDCFILREKALSEADFLALAQRTRAICEASGVAFLANGHAGLALGQHQLSLPDAAVLGSPLPAGSWVSVHSVEDAQQAEALGAAALIFGHVWETTCKAGLEGRGLESLASVIAATPLPVYAIGGVRLGDISQQTALQSIGAAGACIRSGYAEL